MIILCEGIEIENFSVIRNLHTFSATELMNALQPGVPFDLNSHVGRFLDCLATCLQNRDEAVGRVGNGLNPFLGDRGRNNMRQRVVFPHNPRQQLGRDFHIQ